MKNNRLTIGLIISWLHDDYHLPIWNSMEEIAKAMDINLLVFTGAELNTQITPNKGMPAIYQIIDPTLLDGLVIVTSSIRTFISEEQLKKFIDQFKPLPVISIGEAVQGVPSILIENYQSTYEEIEHLIKIHKYKKIAYIRGPENNKEAENRFNAYIDALRDNQITIDTKLIFSGPFTFDTGENGIKILLNERKQKPDALVCANTNITQGAISALTDIGWKIPRDIAVVGFDDSPVHKYSIPPLTTIRLPLEKLTQKAFEALKATIENKKIPDIFHLNAQLIIRQSCGCFPFPILNDRIDNTEAPIRGKEKLLPLKKLLSNLFVNLEFPGIQLPPFFNWLKHYTSSLYNFLKGRLKLKEVLFSLADAPIEQLSEIEDESFWQQTLNTIHKEIIRYCGDVNIIQKNEEIYRKASIYLLELILRPSAHKSIEKLWQAYNVRISHTILRSNLDEAGLIKTFLEEFRKLKIRDCYISEFYEEVYQTSPVSYHIPQWSKSILVFSENMEIPIEEKDKRFPSLHLTPVKLLKDKRKSYIIMPLILDDKMTGIIIFELKTRLPVVFETLRGSVSRELRGLENMEELKRTKSIAESASRIKSEFMANMSHEIRTPMNSILGFTDILLEEVHDKDILAKLKTINMAGKNLLNIMNDVLDFSKIEAGKIVFHIERFSLTDFVNHIIDMFSFKVQEQELLFDIDLDKSVPAYLIGDKQRINQILLNLLGNAFKFTDKGRISLSCKYMNESLHIKVSDTGIGIPQEKLSMIFAPFSQVDSSTTRKFGGTGLGLAISRQLAIQMKGSLTVKSELGKGTTFTIILPLKEAEPIDEEANKILEEAPESISRTQPISQMSLPFKVLVAEDDKMNRDLFETLLTKMNINYRFAENGKEALILLHKEPVDLLLLDMQMPVMDGTQTIAAIRKNKTLKDLYVIAVTAYAIEGDEEKYIKAGCNEYLAKPVDKNVFQEKIINLILKKHNITKDEFKKITTRKTLNGQEKSVVEFNQLDKLQIEKLKKTINRLRGCLKIFDEDTIKDEAQKLEELEYGSGEELKLLKIKLLEALDNYDTAPIVMVIQQLKTLIKPNEGP